MANRFSLNLRPIYGEDEPTRGERLERGVSGAIGQYLDQQDRQRQETEASRVEQNQFAMQGFKPVRRGEEKLAEPARMKPSIGNALGFELEQGAPQEGYEAVQSREGQMFRRPDAGMRASQESERRVSERMRTDPPLTFEQRQRLARPVQSHDERMEIESARTERAESIARLAAQSRATTAAITAGRGNSTTQLTALRNLQTSFDAAVAGIRRAMTAAQRAYQDDEVAALRSELQEAIEQAEENRAAIESFAGRGERPAAPAPRQPPAPTGMAGMRQRGATGGGAPRRPTPPRATGPIVVPPPIKPR